MAQKYGYMANGVAKDVKPCIICDDPKPSYSWTDYHGEGYCLKCGTPYQLVGGELKNGETYPRFNINDEWIPILREFWNETKSTNGAGTFLIGHDYQDQLEGRIKFNEWMKEKHPELIKAEA